MKRYEFEIVGVKVLRDILSKYLERVALGVGVLVTDRSKVISELNKTNANPSDHSFHVHTTVHPLVQQLIDRGLFRPGIEGEFDYQEILKKSSVKSKAGLGGNF